MSKTNKPVSVIRAEYTTTAIQRRKPEIVHGNSFFTICCPVCKERLTLLEGTDELPEPHGSGSCRKTSNGDTDDC